MKPDLRVGTASFALSLVLAGGGLLAANLTEALTVHWVLRLWPVVPILLGIEIAWRAVAAGRRGARLVWDPAALALMVILVLGMLLGSQWPAIQRALVGTPPLQSYTLVQQETLPLKPETARLEVRQAYAPVRLFPWEGPGVKLEARVTGYGETPAQAEANARALVIQVETGPTLFLTTSFPAREAQSLPDQPAWTRPALAAVFPRSSPPPAVADLRLYVPPQITAVKVENSFGDIEATALTCALEATGQSGRVRVEDLVGDLRLEGDFLSGAHVSGVQGRSWMRLSHTAVEVRDCVGPIELESSFAPVTIRRPGAALEVTSRQGNLEVDTDQAPQADWRLETEFAPVRLVLPAESSVRLDATARFGSISAPPEMKVEEDQALARCRHTLGAGEHELWVDCLQGSITIDLR